VRRAAFVPELDRQPDGAPRDSLRLATSDFWERFDFRDSFLWQVLSEQWDLELDERAGLLIYSVYGRRHRRRRATKVLLLGEPSDLPRRQTYDYALSWHLRHDDRHARLPVAIWSLLANPGVEAALEARSHAEWQTRPEFCNFVYNRANARERREFFAALSKRRFVHAPGSVEHNTEFGPGGRRLADWWPRKLDYQRHFRFTIAFENSSFPGYTSEKIVDALLAGTIPIYWGNPKIALDVDPGSFVNAADYCSWDELADYVLRIDDDPQLARRFFENARPVRIDLDRARASIIEIFERARTPPRLQTRVFWALRPWLLALASLSRAPGRTVSVLRSRTGPGLRR
jgi:alpha(1,3/1,4) fucosyltransferase